MRSSSKAHVSLFVAALLLPALASHAHTTSDSYLTLSSDGAALDARWDLSLKDLDFAIGLDDDDDGAVTWRELQAAERRVARYASSHLEIRAGDRVCTAVPGEQKVTRHHDETYAALRFSFRCGDAPVRDVSVRYTLFFDDNPSHRGLLVVEGGAPQTAIFRPEDGRVEISFAGDGTTMGSALSSFTTFLVEGVWHILIGFDHILFLLALLLPAVLRREHRRWTARQGWRPVVLDVLRIVTAFTVAHSITLGLAALGVTRLPSTFVEAGIALSVALVALNNIVPVFRDDRWTVTFALGLLHGFGFSSVLMDLGLPQDARVLSLLGFNIGVEIGQLLVVALFLPLAYALRRTRLYQRVVLVGGSLVIAAIAMLWTVERIFSIPFMFNGVLPW